MNVELLRKIAAVIQEKPAEFDMLNFTAITECGTSHCIGGWAEKLTGMPMRKALGIDYDQAQRLFYIEGDYEDDDSGEEIGGWPHQFRGVDNEWKPTPAQAAARIEHFIATEGRE